VSGLIVFLAEYLPLVIGAVALAFLVIMKERKLAQRAVLAALLALAVSEVIKQFFYVPRPFVAGGFVPLVSQPSDGSFPSSHVATLSALSSCLWFRNKKAGTLLLVGTLVVGLARVLAGLHYGCDILGGFILGGLVGLFVSRRTRKFF